MKLNVFKIEQCNTPSYITVMPAKVVIGHAKVDEWNPETNKGYQRKKSTTRANKAGRYLIKKSGIFPQSIVLNVRDKLKFKKIKDLGICEYGELEIPDGSMPLWEVDGQHRIGGLEYAIRENPEFSNYPVNVTILNIASYEEMKQFYTINTEMKGVRADLAERLISEMVAQEGEKEYRKHGRTKELFIARATKVVDIMNSKEDQPWYKSIQLPNEKKKDNHLIAQRSFVVSLKPVLRKTEGLEVEIVAKILSNYWNAIKERYPKAFESPHEYLIQKTLGVFVFHMLFPRVYSLCGGNFTKDKINEIITKISEESSSESWHKEGEYKPYGGMKGFNYLATILEEYLEEEKPDIQF